MSNQNKGADNTHKKKMQKLKQNIDASIKSANIERGVGILLTGNGKGKSSSAFGMVIRSLGYDHKVGVVQFIKGQQLSGEEIYVRDRCPSVTFHQMNTGFTWETQDKTRDTEMAQAAWEKAKELILDEGNKMVLLDEINIALRYEYIDINKVVKFLSEEKPSMTHVVLTGRNAKEELIEIADLVTEMELVKHPFRSGIKAQIGVEF